MPTKDREPCNLNGKEYFQRSNRVVVGDEMPCLLLTIVWYGVVCYVLRSKKYGIVWCGYWRSSGQRAWSEFISRCTDAATFQHVCGMYPNCRLRTPTVGYVLQLSSTYPDCWLRTPTVGYLPRLSATYHDCRLLLLLLLLLSMWVS